MAVKEIAEIHYISKLLTCVLLYFGEAAVGGFFIQDLHLNFYSSLAFRRGSGSSVKAIMQLSAALPLAILVKNVFGFQ